MKRSKLLGLLLAVAMLALVLTLCGCDQGAPACTAHTYGAWQIKADSTCQRPGEEVRTCSACGQEESRAVAQAAHTYGEWQVTAAAT